MQHRAGISEDVNKSVEADWCQTSYEPLKMQQMRLEYHRGRL